MADGENRRLSRLGWGDGGSVGVWAAGEVTLVSAQLALGSWVGVPSRRQAQDKLSLDHRAVDTGPRSGDL